MTKRKNIEEVRIPCINISFENCWQCNGYMKVAYFSDNTTIPRGPEAFSKKQIKLALQEGCNIALKHSNTMNEDYMTNFCNHCGAIKGQWFYHDYSYIDGDLQLFLNQNDEVIERKINVIEADHPNYCTKPDFSYKETQVKQQSIDKINNFEKPVKKPRLIQLPNNKLKKDYAIDLAKKYNINVIELAKLDELLLRVTLRESITELRKQIIDFLIMHGARPGKDIGKFFNFGYVGLYFNIPDNIARIRCINASKSFLDFVGSSELMINYILYNKMIEKFKEYKSESFQELCKIYGDLANAILDTIIEQNFCVPMNLPVMDNIKKILNYSKRDYIKII